MVRLTRQSKDRSSDGTSFSVVKTNVFLMDMNDFSAMNEVYSEGKTTTRFQVTRTMNASLPVFTDHHPARSTVQVAGLPRVS